MPRSRKKDPSAALFAPEHRPLIERAIAELQHKTAALDAVTHFSKAEWTVDQDVGTIIFERDDGIQLSAPVQIIGTYNSADKTWLWAWDNPSIEKPLTRAAAAVQAYGQEHGISSLTTRKISCEEGDCWAFTALGAKLDDAQGAYRGPAGPTYVFMTFGKVEMSKPAD